MAEDLSVKTNLYLIKEEGILSTLCYQISVGLQISVGHGKFSKIPIIVGVPNYRGAENFHPLSEKLSLT